MAHNTSLLLVVYLCVLTFSFVDDSHHAQFLSNRSKIWFVGYTHDFEDHRRPSMKPEVVTVSTAAIYFRFSSL